MTNRQTPTILNFKPFQKNTLQAFFDVELPSGMILCGCALHQKGEHFWIGLPARSSRTNSGAQS